LFLCLLTFLDIFLKLIRYKSFIKNYNMSKFFLTGFV
jgi:hypothetical protein